MSKHSEGPWNIEDNARSSCIWSHKVGEIAVVRQSVRRGISVETRQANAQVISHALDMLDALKQWAAAEQTSDAEELENARKSRDAAIAAAEGRS